MRTHRMAILVVAGLLLAGPVAAQQFENVPEAKPAQAAAPPAGANIAVVDFQGVMVNTQEGRKAAEDLRAQFNPRNAELEKIRNEIRDLENQARAQERTLSDEARMQLVRQMEQKRKMATRMEQDLRDDFEAAQNEIISRLGEKVQRVIDQYAQEKGLNLVLSISQGSPIVFATRSVDITPEIIQLYDKNFPVQAATGATQQPARPAPPPRSNRPQ
ncbi:MAG: OmpH family outer membrane protein [Acidobacteria bacterium]|nr:OmpH family outer membrane protein [Acidobacteriota bacterium]